MNTPRTIVLDFETFYDKAYSLREMSYPEYILDPRFKVFGVAVDNGDDQDFVLAPKIPSLLKSLKNDIIVMHNAFFDAGVLAWHYKFNPAYMIDTLGLANHVLGAAKETGKKNDLRTLAESLGLEPKGRLDFMLGVNDPDEAQLAALGAYARQDAKLERQVLDILLPQVSNPDFELWLLDHTLRIYTNRMLTIDAAKVKETLVKVERRRSEIVAASGATPEVLNSNKQFAEELTRRLKLAKLKAPMKRGKKGMIPALAKGDPGFVKLTDSPAAPVAALVKARLVQRSAITTAARLATMAKYVKLGIGIPVHLVYYGAHTGRFSGGGGFNFQNLTSPARATTAEEREIASMVREAVVAGNGDVFVEVDAAQIEARVLAWLAGEQSILDAFGAGADLYSQFISEVLGEDVHKPTPEEQQADPQNATLLNVKRQVGKESVLGLGYSMGGERFYTNVRAGGSVKSPALRQFVADGHFGKERRTPRGGVTSDMAEGIVKHYREKYPNIVQFWHDLNAAFVAAIKGASRRVGPLLFQRAGSRHVQIILPSGRVLNFRNLRSELVARKAIYVDGSGRRVVKNKTERVWKHGNGQKIYGGLLAENVTQAVARDILVEAIPAAESAGYPVVLHVHDSIVSRVSEVHGKAALEFLETQLSTPPQWGAGLVLGAEGHVAKNLSK